MKKFESRMIWGILLIVGGILFLLQSLNVLVIGDVVWPLLFGAGGLVFLFVFLTDYRQNWWAAIPGFVLLGLAGTIAMDRLAPRAGEVWSGAVFLAGIGLAFWAIYATNREHWWAVIPGGVLLTLAIVTGISSLPAFAGGDVGGIFFLGLGLTFGLLALLPTPEGRLRWAFIPATVLLVMGALTTAAAVEILSYVWPVALILAGLYFLYRTFGSR